MYEQQIHEQIYYAKIHLHNLVVQDWLSIDLFSPRWFGTAAFILFSYTLVFSLLDKSRLTQLFLFGSLMTVAVTLLDVVGTAFVRWTYLTRLLPIMPSLFLYDYTIIPLYYMLVYQYGTSWKRFILGNAVLAGIISFGFFPLLISVRMFQLHDWSNAYFFPIVFTFALICRFVVLNLMSIESKRRESTSLQYATNLTPQPAMKPLDNKEESNKE